MHNGEHHYDSHLTWEGNRGDGTATYEGYGREHRIVVEGKPALQLSADAVFLGDPARLNPEDLFVAALSSCHMLTYLALCARARIQVVAYEDRSHGVMREDGRGGGRFEEVVLRPVVTITDPAKRERALALHHKAHELCYVAASCSTTVRHEPEIVVAEQRA